MAVTSRHEGGEYLGGGVCRLLHHESALLGITDIEGVLRALDAYHPCHDATRVTLTGTCGQRWRCGKATRVSPLLWSRVLMRKAGRGAWK